MNARTEKIIRVFRKRFVQRNDCFARQTTDGTYSFVRERLTERVLCRHLRGEETISLYPFPDSTTHWICFDIDTLEGTETRVLQEKLQDHGIPHLTEFSGRKGFHIWTFFDQKYPNWIARAFGRILAAKIEVFPKQDKITNEGLGNALKAPLGKHQVTDRWCLFVDEEYTDLDDSYGALEAVATINPIEVLTNQFPEDWRRLNRPTRTTPEEGTPSPTQLHRPPVLKDCIQRQLHSGKPKGQRNSTGHIVAAELRKTGLTQGQTCYLLEAVWNPETPHPSRTTKSTESSVTSLRKAHTNMAAGLRGRSGKGSNASGNRIACTTRC